ncbi:MAG: hypothetical protein JRN02_07000 [Nitrososphaerota archaeon]|nr:hypothetical protein [Nitrososphaerota archaeon]MDG7036493.1 hypothetical protein [Nitrososphaerota archaeon]MDG7045103.1 hypothetical protein [Nitrososphaerota archaeon]
MGIMGSSGEFVIYYDEKIEEISNSISASLKLESNAVKFSSDSGLTSNIGGSSGNRPIVIWSIVPPYDRDMFKLCLTLSRLNSTSVLILLPMAYQKGGLPDSEEGFTQYMDLINQFKVQRLVFVDLTPIKRLGITAAESVSLSTFPLLIEQLKRDNYRAKVITFNPDLNIAVEVIEHQVGVEDGNVLIIDNLVSRSSELKPVASVYLKKANNVRFYATYFLDDPSELKSFGEVTSTNTIAWDVRKLDLTGQLIDYIKTLY